MSALLQCITNFAIISLIIGLFVGVYSPYKMPEKVSWLVALYLVFCIGFKGGMCLGVAHTCTQPLLLLALIGAMIGFIQPFIYFFVLRNVASLDFQTNVVVAAQYGSISIVTFVTALSFLQRSGIYYDTFLTAVAGMMEIPALFSGLLILKSRRSSGKDLLAAFGTIAYKIIKCEKISVIFLGFFIGYMLRDYQQHVAVQWFLWPFSAMLVLFMIDIGIKIAQQRNYIHQFTWSLIAFGIYVPMMSGCLSIMISWLLGLQVGTAVLFAVLIGSASYIAVPAVMGTQAPDAKEVIYLPLSLCVTLPFNLIFGIPFFYFIASLVL